MRKNQVKYTALCGVLAGVAIVIMCLGGLIPIATYVTPMLCILIGELILRGCGRRFAWTWYAAVSILALLLGPDKEAALLFCFLGGYPCMKQIFEKSKLQLLWKILYFNASIFVLYLLICNLFGLTEIIAEYSAFGTAGLAIFIVLGNITFFLIDRILSFAVKKRK